MPQQHPTTTTASAPETRRSPQLTAKDLMNTLQYENTRDALKAAPALVEHIVSITPAKGQAGSEDDTVRAKRAEPPLPMNSGAWSDANELYARLVYWVEHWAAALHVPAAGPARRAWRNASTNVVGLPAAVTPADARYAVGIMATWLTVHLDEIARRTPDDVDYFATEVAEIHQAAARWPRDLQARYSNLACRITGCAGQVVLYPFETVTRWVEKGKHLFLPPEGAQVICEECGDRWTQAEYADEIARRILAAKEQRRTERTQARLAKKYAEPSRFPLFLGTVGGRVRHTTDND